VRFLSSQQVLESQWPLHRLPTCLEAETAPVILTRSTFQPKVSGCFSALYLLCTTHPSLNQSPKPLKRRPLLPSCKPYAFPSACITCIALP
jgi:hypothetical protein